MKNIGIIVLVIVVIILIFSSFSDKPSEPDDIMAYIMAKSFVENQLKAPSTAKFADSWDSTITKTGLDTWKVISYVDSQNSFGAMIRTHFTVVIKFTENDKCRLISLDYN